MRPARRVGESYVLMAAKYGKPFSSQAIAERFRICFDTAPPLAFPGASEAEIDLLERNWWKDLVRRIFEPWGYFEGFDEYFSDLFGHFARPDAWTLYPDVPETLAALRQRGLILDVISNFDSRLMGILEGLDAAHWFEHVFISSRVGYAKPAREIFEAALRHHGIDAQNAAHIGDSQDRDIHGALNAGLKAILVDRERDNRSAPVSRVASLKEVLYLLDDSKRLDTSMRLR
jgi:putative hydrolase of the HAD superfamily